MLPDVDILYYCYRQRETSVMYSTGLKKRLCSDIMVCNRLLEFAGRYDFSGFDKELKNWLYVKIFSLYSRAFSYLYSIKDSGFILPAHHLDCFWRDCPEMMPEPQRICKVFYLKAEQSLKMYTDWRMSDFVASVNYKRETGKKIMLLYNTKPDLDLSLKIEEVPNDWVVTVDHRYLQDADVVVFYIPNLARELENDLDKPDNQIWVGQYVENENIYPNLKNSEFSDLFDIWMSYGDNTEIFCEHLRESFIERIEEQNEHPLVRLCRKVDEMEKNI